MGWYVLLVLCDGMYCYMSTICRVCDTIENTLWEYLVVCTYITCSMEYMECMEYRKEPICAHPRYPYGGPLEHITGWRGPVQYMDTLKEYSSLLDTL